MFYTENNNIIMTKGDSGKCSIKLCNKDGSKYEAKEGDEVILSVKRRKESFTPLIIKKTGIQVVFNKADTEVIPSGKYVYDVVLLRNGKERYTVAEGNFEIRKAAHDFE